MSAQQIPPICPDCVNVRQKREAVTDERNNLRQQVAVQQSLKERVMGLEQHMQALNSHLIQIFERLQKIEERLNPWDGKEVGVFDFSVKTVPANTD